MPCCCVKTLNLCSKSICGSIEFDVLANGESGESGLPNYYTLVLDYLGTQIRLKQIQESGQKVTFNIGSLNENFEYTGNIYDSEGELVSITSGEDVYDCVKFKTVQGIGIGGSVVEESSEEIVVIEAVVGGNISITGTLAAVIGIEEDSNEITCFEFAGRRITFIRGNVPIPGIDPGDSSNFYTKDLASNTILLSSPLIEGEFIRIETII